MAPDRRHGLDAILAHPQVNGVLSGVGWSNYEDSWSVKDNLARLMPGGCDLVVFYKPLGNLPETKALRELDMLDVPSCVRFNEAWWDDDRAVKELVGSRSRFVVCHHANDMRQFKVASLCEEDTPVQWANFCVHNPHCAKRSLFEKHAKPWDERQIPLLVTGMTMRSIYPLRARMASLVNRGKLPGVVREHPGYRVVNARMRDEQLEDYAREMGDSKIVVVTSSRFKYALSKYPEAAQSGALVLGDLPDERHDEFEGWLAVIDQGWSDSRIVEEVERWMDDDDGARRRAEMGAELNRTKYDWRQYADRFVSHAKLFLQWEKDRERR